MLPILFTIGPVKFYTLGLFLVLALFWGSFILWKLINLTPYKNTEAFDVLSFCLAGAVGFARIFFVILNWPTFGFNLLKIILINGYPGMSLVGALFGAFIFFAFYCFYRKKSFYELVDYFVVPLFLALSIGKIGSFISGVDVGTKTDFMLSTNVVGYIGRRQVVGLYEALFYFVGFIASYKMLFKIRREQLNQGTIFFYFLLFFSLTNLFSLA